MAYGPLEYYIIGFEGHKFTGDIAPALKKAADSGAIRILDLVFVTKDGHGAVSAIEYEHFDKEVAHAFSRIDKNGEGLFTSEDLEEIGKGIGNDSVSYTHLLPATRPTAATSRWASSPVW